MIPISVIGDATSDGSVIVVLPTNTKITYNNIPLCLLGAIVAPHLDHGGPPIINVIQSKVFFNNIPFSIYGSVIGCGAAIVGSQINSKILITP